MPRMNRKNKKNYKKRRIEKINRKLVVLLASLSVIFVFLFGTMLFFHPEPIATVMIDAGHGGYDPGSIGYDGTLEKDMTLNLALRTGRALKELNPKIEVVYTREDDRVDWAMEDEVTDLKGRVALTKEAEADYFLSIHLNSNYNTEAYGYNAYVRPEDTVSQELAKKISQNLEASEWCVDRGMQFTDMNPLYVVNNQSIPAILFEVGFISNPEELEALKKEKNQERIA